MEGRRLASARLAGVLTVLAWAAAGCASDAKPRPIEPARDLHDPDPGRRLAAVAIVAETQDRARFADLVELLDDRDPSIRMAANRTLQDMTGRKTAYRAYDPPAERRPFVDEWRAWLEGTADAGFPAPSAGEGS